MDNEEEISPNANRNLMAEVREESFNTIETKELTNNDIAQQSDSVSQVDDDSLPPIVEEDDKGVGGTEAVLTGESKMAESTDAMNGFPVLDAQTPIAEPQSHETEVAMEDDEGNSVTATGLEARVEVEDDKGVVGEAVLTDEPKIEASGGGLNGLPLGDGDSPIAEKKEEAGLAEQGNPTLEAELDGVRKDDEDDALLGEEDPSASTKFDSTIGKNGEGDAPVKDEGSSANAKLILETETDVEISGGVESSSAELHDLQLAGAEKVVVVEEETPVADSKMEMQSEPQLPVAEEECPSLETNRDVHVLSEVTEDDDTGKCGLESLERAELVPDEGTVSEQVTEILTETEIDNGAKFVQESENSQIGGAKLFKESEEDSERGEETTTAETNVEMEVEQEIPVEVANDEGENVCALHDPHVPGTEALLVTNQDEDNETKQAAEEISTEVAQVRMDMDTKTEVELAKVPDLANSDLFMRMEVVQPRSVSKNDEEEEMSTQLTEDIMITDGKVDTEMETEKEVNTEAEEVEEGGGGGESVGDLDSSQVVGEDEEDEATGAEEETPTAEAEMELDADGVELGKLTRGKRKRGKNPKVSANSGVPVRASSRKTIEEDVCFICFDGGDLVLCDRRGCPKAYHPSCVNRDEAFFRAKGRWNCGWHLCSICEKNAHYMCYTCTFSLCKGCIKDAVILCVRGNKGFCETCMKTVMLIESNQQGDKEAQVDFDDRSSWEYLFKDYYIELKKKLSLSLEELSQARNPWKGFDATAGKEDSPEEQFDTNDDRGSSSDNSAENFETSKPKRRKPKKKRSRTLVKEADSTSSAVAAGSYVISEPGNTDWASKELLELVMHMKNGDKSVLSQFDVQALLLEYIKLNKLRDPRRKSQIICDSRLESLFGKPRVGHFEMLKLLESHFYTKEDSQTDDIQGSVVDNEVSQLEGDGNFDAPAKGSRDKKRKARKKGNGRAPQLNLDDYAAIDMHNINLIFLRRKWMEDLLEDIEKFHDKVVGSFVRIRISSNNQKQDLYRLVYVLGTSGAAEPYRIGKRTCDIMLEILNLNKTEIISIDTISNQEFNEEECKRLRQSIKCGLINRLTVGDVLDKAMELQPVRVDDWLETEIVRLSHLRDRASDTGRRKQLRECVEKLQLLKSPEERQRRLEAVPEIHADPKMDPNHESENESDMDENRQEAYLKPRGSGLGRRAREPISPGRGEFSAKDSFSGIRKNSSKSWELNRSFSDKNFSRGEDSSPVSEIFNGNSWNQGRDRDAQQNDLEKLSSTAKSEFTGWNNHSALRPESFSGVASERSPASSLAEVTHSSPKISESEKMWHYKDPTGKEQGPFSLVQLRKWSNTGYFPVDLRIWRAAEEQDDSILLTDALAGRLQKVFPAMDNKSAEASALQSSHVLSSHTGKFSETQVPNTSRGWMTPSVEVPKVSSRWVEQDSSNLPSPTPKPTTAGRDRGEGVMDVHSYSGSGLQSPAASNPNSGLLSHSSASASGLSSDGHLVRASAGDSLGSRTGFSRSPTSEQGILANSANSLQTTQSAVASESRSVQKHTHFVAVPDTAAHSVQSLNNINPQMETRGWSSAPSQNLEANSTMPASGQPTTYAHWSSASLTVQNPSGTFPTPSTSALPQSDFWRPPVPGNQSNMQPLASPNLPWGAGSTENAPTAQGSRPDNQNSGWGTIQGNPNMGWGQVPGATNMAWGATVQGPSPGNMNPGWLVPMGNPTVVPGPAAPGNVNPGWVAPTANRGPGVQGLAPGNANSGWVTPAGNMGATASGQPGAIVNTAWGQPGGNIQGPAPGNLNPGWGGPAANQGTWGNDQQWNKDNRFSGQRDWGGSHGGDSGYGDRTSWKRQSSFGNGGPGASPIIPKSHRICPYYAQGHCKKGASCDYLHS